MSDFAGYGNKTTFPAHIRTPEDLDEYVVICRERFIPIDEIVVSKDDAASLEKSYGHPVDGKFVMTVRGAILITVIGD